MKKFNIMVLIGLGVSVLTAGCEYHKYDPEAQERAVQTEPQATADENIVTPPNNEAFRGLEDRINELTNRLNTTPPSREAEIQGLRDQIANQQRELEALRRERTMAIPDPPSGAPATPEAGDHGASDEGLRAAREDLCARTWDREADGDWFQCCLEGHDLSASRVAAFNSCILERYLSRMTPEERYCYGEQPRAMDTEQVDCCLKGYKYDTPRWNACVNEAREVRRATEEGSEASENAPTLNVTMTGECALQEEDAFDECDVETLSVTFSLSGENVASIDVSCSGGISRPRTLSQKDLGGAAFSNVPYRDRWAGEADSAQITCVFTARGTNGMSVVRRMTGGCSDNRNQACNDDFDWTIYDLNGRQIHLYDD